jgi:surface polysaccharide O-acyltransferase-like enzyme
MRRLLPPVLGLIGVWVGIGFVLRSAIDAEWIWPAVILVLSPLWFIVVYLVLVALAPLAVRLHWRWGELAIVWLLGLAAVLDVLRFTHGQSWAAWINFLVIWGLAHQLGFFYDRLIDAPRRTAWALLWGGLFALIALTNMGFYPRSMVGVPGERFSNMGPPTLAIVALTILQIGVVLLVRDSVINRLDTDRRWQKLSDWVTENSMGLYLFHTTGMALVVAALYLAFDYLPPAEPTFSWWLSRPIWIIGPAIATYPFLRLYRRITVRPAPLAARHRSG